jgi:DNA-binding MarR family transcriptional regulator
MKSDHLDEAVELLIDIPPVMHRKLHHLMLREAIDQAKQDMAPHHVTIMKMLKDIDAVPVSKIGNEIGISSSQMTHSTDRLISLGMIERQPDERDRRVVNIKLTTKGRETLEQMRFILKDQAKVTLSPLTDEDLDLLVISLRNIADIFLNKL